MDDLNEIASSKAMEENILEPEAQGCRLCEQWQPVLMAGMRKCKERNLERAVFEKLSTSALNLTDSQADAE